MVFKLLIVLAILILHTDAKNSVNIPLNKWELYGNDLLTLIYKRQPSDTERQKAKDCSRGRPYGQDCTPLSTPRSTETYPGKRTWGKLDFMNLLRSISRGETPESEIYDYENEPDE